MNNAIFYAQYFNILYQCLRFSAFRNVHRPRKQIAKREKNKYLPCILLYKRRCSQSVGRTTNFCLSHFDTPHGCLRNNRRRNLCVYERNTFGALVLCVKKINMITTLTTNVCLCPNSTLWHMVVHFRRRSQETFPQLLYGYKLFTKYILGGQ